MYNTVSIKRLMKKFSLTRIVTDFNKGEIRRFAYFLLKKTPPRNSAWRRNLISN